MKRITAFVLVTILILTAMSVSFATSNANGLDKQLVAQTEGIYDLSNFSMQEINELLEANLDNDKEFRKLLKSKAIKENKLLDIDKYESDMAKVKNLEDVDKVLKKYSDKVVFEHSRNLTAEEFEVFKSTSINDPAILATATVDDFVLTDIYSYSYDSSLDNKRGIFNQIAETSINIAMSFVKPVYGVAYAILGSFGSSSQYYSSDMQVTTLVDSSLTNRRVYHKDNVTKSWAFADRKREYNDVRLIIWKDGVKVSTDYKELGLVRDRYHNMFLDTAALKQKALEEYNRNGWGVSYLYGSSSANDYQFDRSYYFPATEMIK